MTLTFRPLFASFLVCFLVLALVNLKLARAQEDEIELLESPIAYGRVLFSYRLGEDDDIYLLDFSTGDIEPLVKLPSSDSRARWSQDARKIVFQSNRFGQYDIFALSGDSPQAVRLTNSKENEEEPDWAPDASTIVLQSDAGNGTKRLYLINADGKNPRPLKTYSGTTTIPRWSPRGTEILYTTDNFWPGWDLALYQLNSNTNTQLTNGVQGFCRGSWNLDGSGFAFSYGVGSEIDIWQYEKGADRISPLVVRPGKDYDPEWVDEGKILIFSAEVPEGSDRYELFAWQRSTQKVTRLTRSRGSLRHPSWTPLPSLKSLQENFKNKLDARKNE